MVALLVGIVGAALTFGVSKAYRCIDTAEFYYLPALAYAWVGAGLVLFGGISLGTHRRMAIVLVVVGVILLTLGIAGPPFKGCRWFE